MHRRSTAPSTARSDSDARRSACVRNNGWCWLKSKPAASQDRPRRESTVSFLWLYLVAVPVGLILSLCPVCSGPEQVPQNGNLENPRSDGLSSRRVRRRSGLVCADQALTRSIAGGTSPCRGDLDVFPGDWMRQHRYGGCSDGQRPISARARRRVARLLHGSRFRTSFASGRCRN